MFALIVRDIAFWYSVVVVLVWLHHILQWLGANGCAATAASLIVYKIRGGGEYPWRPDKVDAGSFSCLAMHFVRLSSAMRSLDIYHTKRA